MQLMALKTHNPKGAVVMYHMHNGGHVDSIVDEGRRILEKARDLEMAGSMGDKEFKWGEAPIPEFTSGYNEDGQTALTDEEPAEGPSHCVGCKTRQALAGLDATCQRSESLGANVGGSKFGPAT